MRKLFVMLSAVVIAATARADEGMWLLPYLEKMNIERMQELGLELSAEDIYSANQPSIKDAIVIFGNGCTGEIVSKEGLLFTNHHCGFGSIQALSSVGADYLKDGFWAMNNGEELPAPGLSVRFIRQIVDVTPDIIANVPSIAGETERREIVAKNIAALKKSYEKKYSKSSDEVSIKPFFGGNQYFMFIMERYDDIRLVGTPPSSIGKFGGDTDNWMWPRHTGDFSIFRVYADKDNRAAAYSPDNKPYETEEYLRISLDGYQKDDYSMILGFPGSTQRYMTSYEIDQMLETTNPQMISVRDARQQILLDAMMASDKVRIQYASKYASSSNYWKNAIGMTRGINKLDVKSKKLAQEKSYMEWATRNTFPQERYIDALELIREGVEQGQPLRASQQMLTEAIYRAVNLATIVPTLDSKMDKRLSRKERTELETLVAALYKDYDEPTERAVTKKMFAMVKESVADLPSFYATIESDFGGDIDKYVDHLYDSSVFATADRVTAFINDYSRKSVDTDPVVALLASVKERSGELGGKLKKWDEKVAEGHRLYIAGLMMQQPDKDWASDANFTIRLSYGQILPYSPADGVLYEYQTSLAGVIAKEDPANLREFTVEDRLKEIYNDQDYGRYADADGKMPVAFLSNNDITGGNSGSPVLNARGELIGLAFDGNWEAMSGDVAFEPELQRTISVDVRYLLLILDKFADAGWLLDEMTIIDNN